MAFENYPSAAYEIVFSYDAFFKTADDLDLGGRRLWANTLQAHHAAGRLDRDGGAEPDRVWGELIDLGADIIQTDEPRALIEYLDENGLR